MQLDVAVTEGEPTETTAGARKTEGFAQALSCLGNCPVVRMSTASAAAVLEQVCTHLPPATVAMEVAKFCAHVEKGGRRVEAGEAKFALLRWLEQGIAYRARAQGAVLQGAVLQGAYGC